VRTVLHELVDIGIIRVDRPSGQHLTNCYRFLLPIRFNSPRGARIAGPPPEGQSVHQTGNLCTPEGQILPPNHKEPSVETRISAIANIKRGLGVL
jgi:hypothetical protein